MPRYIIFAFTLFAVVLSEGRFCSSDGFWPQTETFQEVTMNCDAGSLTRRCMGDMEWGRIEDNNCQCVPNEDIPVLHNVNRGETIEHQCDRGYIEVTCNMTGTWNDKDIIPHDCYCAKDSGFRQTETEEFATKACTLGEVERFCNFGKWDAPNYDACFNFNHKCTLDSYKKVELFISPNSDKEDVTVCVLPVLRNARMTYTVEDIKTLGYCTTERDANGQFRVPLELEPNSYTALIYAHTDYTSVKIYALEGLKQEGGYYAFQFTMDSCGNTLFSKNQDSYSITLSNTYIWAESNPTVTIYYTDDMSLKLKDLAKFSKKTFSGKKGYVEQTFKISGLKPNTEYQFYSVVSNEYNNIRSNRVVDRTFKLCQEGEWPAVGVLSYSEIACTIGSHRSFCAKGEGREAVFQEPDNSTCRCAAEEVYGVFYGETAYGDVYVTPYGKRSCGWKGIWADVPTRSCDPFEGWPAAYDGQNVVKQCDNGGSLQRKCVFGVWQEIVDNNCGCPGMLLDEITWSAGNREEIVVHQCDVGTQTRQCTFWGTWEAPVNNGCGCAATEDGWLEAPKNTTNTLQCGTANDPANIAVRRCSNAGFWEEADFAQCGCDATVEFGIAWPKTLMGVYAVVECGVGANGRYCGANGSWATNYSGEHCFCAAEGEWPQTLATLTHELPCPDSSAADQSRLCLPTGTWDKVDATQCFGSCVPFGAFPTTRAGTTASQPCSGGTGAIVMDCLKWINPDGLIQGEWDYNSWRVEGECYCPEDDFFPATLPNELATVECDLGSRERMCGKYTAAWEDPVNNGCSCTVPQHPEIVVPLGESATSIPCEVGSRDAVCGNSGHFDNLHSTTCYCAEDDATGFLQTPAGITTYAECAESGQKSRACLDSGYWEEEINYAACRCNTTSTIFDAVQDGKFFMTPGELPFLYECPVGGYHIECDEQGNTIERDSSCMCAEDKAFRLPDHPAGESFKDSCGAGREMSADCNELGQWENVNIDQCLCEATDKWPQTFIGEYTEGFFPSCVRAKCESDGHFSEDTSRCHCDAYTEEHNGHYWPALDHGDQTVHNCTSGGHIISSCNMGVRSFEYIDCGCTDHHDAAVAVGGYDSFPCMIGFKLKQCRGDEFWHPIADSYCGCSSTEAGLELFRIVAADKVAEAQCGSGTMSITCTAEGSFDLSSWVKNCKCPAEGDWPETAAGASATMACSSDPSVTVTRVCGEYGTWEDVQGTCRCPFDGFWHESEPGMQVQACEGSGVVLHRLCQDNGEWGEATGSCNDESCPADGPFPHTAHLGSYTHTCGNGVQLVRTCTAGQWSEVDWSQCGCADEDGFVSGEFIDSSSYSALASQPCGYGERVRECRYGYWLEVNLANCFCPAEGPLPLTRALETATAECGEGAVVATCNAVGAWEIQNDNCRCAADAQTVEDVLFPATFHGETASVECLEGAMTRRCGENGLWETVDYATCRCAGEGYTTAAPMEYGSWNCEEGSVTRMCMPNGHWGSTVSDQCACDSNDYFARNILYAEAVYHCDVGTLTSSCTIMGWAAEKDNGCQCGAIDGYPATARGMVGEAPCGLYMAGTKTRACLMSGVWSSDEDESACIPYCPAIGEFDFTAPGTTATLDSCPEGFGEGTVTRVCNAKGEWEQAVSTCVPMRCPADGDFPSTAVNVEVTLPCSNSQQAGQRTRRCEVIAGVVQWTETQDTCALVQCMYGDIAYAYDSTVTAVCDYGYTGSRLLHCVAGEWEELSSSCTPVSCPADPAHGLQEGVLGSIQNVSCGVDYTGYETMRCNAQQQWEKIEGACVPIEPTLRCQPADGAQNVALSAITGEDQYTIVCTSNVRIQQVINDDLENMNVHLVFHSNENTLSYATSAVPLSEYTVAFLFQGSLPASTEGTLYVNSNCFVAYNGWTFPETTLVASFATRAGTPVSPTPLREGSITIASVDHERRTATLNITIPMDSAFYEEGELVFIGSNLQSVRCTTGNVLVEGALLNNVINVTWRVRQGDYWSSFAEFYPFLPLALVKPATPVVSSYSAQTISWSWEAAALYGMSLDHYEWILYAEGEEVQRGTTLETTLTLDALQPNTAYTLVVGICSDSNAVYSDPSEAVTVLSAVYTPSKPRNVQVTPLSSSSVRVNWEAPANSGGATITNYRVRRANTEAMTVVLATYDVPTTELVLTDITGPCFLEVAAFNGYLSAFEKVAVTPVPMTVEWTTNADEGLALDNAIVLKGHFSYLAAAVCEVTNAATNYQQTITFPASNEVETIVRPLAAATTYTFACDVTEVGTTTASHAEFAATTAATADLTPALVVNGESTTSITASVHVTANMLGHVACVVSPYEDVISSRPTSLAVFAGTWAQSAEITSVADTIDFLFTVDSHGDVIDAAHRYHAWCVLEREMLVYPAGSTTPAIVTLTFPEYSVAANAAAGQAAGRRLLQTVEAFEVVAVSPAEFATDVDPSADIVLRFSKPAVVSENGAAITLLSETNELVTIPADQILCNPAHYECVLRLEGALRSQTQYVLNVPVDAFEGVHVNSEGQPEVLEQAVENHFFETGLQRCDTKYVSKGLWNSKMCECFSIEGKCECECGETSVMRHL